MKNLFIITEEERKRILGLHESATKRQYLSEQWPKGQLFRKGGMEGGRTDVVDATGKQVRIASGNDFDLPIYGSQAPIGGTVKKGVADPNQRTVPTSTNQLTQKGYYLRKGDKGPLVKTIQTKLLDAGEDVALTSIFDDMTKKAVMSFQTKNNLVNPKTKQPDGIVGPKTWALLSKAKMQNMTPREAEPLKTIAPSNVPADYGKTTQGVADVNKTPVNATRGGSGMGQMYFDDLNN